MNQIDMFEIMFKMILNYINTLVLNRGAHDPMVIVVGNGHSDTSSNPG